MNSKYQQLVDIITAYDRHVGVCVSGGSDSTLVLVAAVDALGKDRVTAITAYTAFITGREMTVAEDLSHKLGVTHVKPRVNLMQNDMITKNDENKCVYCKREIMKTLSQTAIKHKISLLLNGTHASVAPDDKIETHRGVRVESPLQKADITRHEIESILEELGFSHYIRPASSCLAARIAQGERITIKKLRWLRAAENYIMSLGFDYVWVSVTDMNADVSVQEQDVERLMGFEDEIREELTSMGYKSVTINPKGHTKKLRCFGE